MTDGLAEARLGRQYQHGEPRSSRRGADHGLPNSPAMIVNAAIVASPATT